MRATFLSQMTRFFAPSDWLKTEASASHETIKILQLKVSRLEQLLTLKDKRISELKKQVEERQAYEDH